MTLKKLLLATRDRVPFTIAKQMLVNCNIPMGQGWEKTFEKTESYKCAQVQLEKLVKHYKEHLLYGEKYIHYYDLTNEQIAELRQYFKNTKIKEGSFSKAYPLPLPQSELNKLPLVAPMLVAVEEREGGLAAIYSSVRIIEKRDVISLTDLPKEYQERFDGYSELVAVKALRTQAFDVIWIPKNGNRIDIRADALPEFTQSHTELAQSKLLEVLNKNAKSPLGAPVNMFPLIQKIYQADGEGTLVELAFNTTTASQKHEKMRRRSRELCLRKELYHCGGKAALKGKIEPYKLGVQWHTSIDGRIISSPELNIFGTSRMLHEASPALYGITVRKCSSIEDFHLVQTKIKKYLAA